MQSVADVQVHPPEHFVQVSLVFKNHPALQAEHLSYAAALAV